MSPFDELRARIGAHLREWAPERREAFDSDDEVAYNYALGSMDCATWCLGVMSEIEAAVSPQSPEGREDPQ